MMPSKQKSKIKKMKTFEMQNTLPYLCAIQKCHNTREKDDAEELIACYIY